MTGRDDSSVGSIGDGDDMMRRHHRPPAGRGADDVVVPAAVADLLRSLATDGGADTAAYEGSAASVAYRRRYLRTRTARVRLAAKASAIVAACTVGVGSVAAAAYAGVLPEPAQRVAHRLIHAPAPKADRAPHPVRPGHRGEHGHPPPDPRRGDGGPRRSTAVSPAATRLSRPGDLGTV